MKRSFAALLGVLSMTLSTVGDGFQWGVNGHPMSQEGYFHVPIEHQLDLVAELGAGWYRVDLGAKQFAAETARFDRLVSEAATRKIRILPVLFPSPHAREASAPSEIRTAASNFAALVARRYRGRITLWELSNELDAYALLAKGETNRAGILWKWDGSPDGSSPENYEENRYRKAHAELLGLHEGIKAADPEATTIVNTAGWLHYGFIERLVREDRVPFDVLGWHWYSEMGDMTNVQGRLDLIGLLSGFGKPLAITEFNRRDGSKDGQEAEQAGYLDQSARQLRTHRGIRGLFVYELLDEPYFGPSGESHYGLVQLTRGRDGRWQAGARKPAFDAIKRRIAAAP